MRGSTAKELRKVARIRYMEMVANGEINPPESPAHSRHQFRVLYRGLKRAFGNMPHDVRGRFLAPWRKSRTASRSTG